MKRSDITLLSPAGSFAGLHAAIQGGADAVYFGVEQLNMRSRSAGNFSTRDLDHISTLCQKHKVKSHLALNTIIYDDELEMMKHLCLEAKRAGIDAVIATDVSTITFAHSIGLPVHVSTQANISNLEAVKFYADYAEVLVLARELTLETISHIINEIARQNIVGPQGKLVQIELFVHGAMCVSIAGKCYMSLAVHNHSANRGECLQNCRKRYRVIDESTDEELILDNQFVMSPKDLCMIRYLDKLLDAGVQVLKIEGRGRAADYVFHTTQCYRRAIENYFDGSWDERNIEALITQLERVFNRGFWHGGYYLGNPLGEWAGAYGSVATTQKTYLGYAVNYYAKAKIGHFILENDGLKPGDTVAVIGPTTGYLETAVTGLFVDDDPASSAGRGDQVTFPLGARVRRNDKLYLIHERKHRQT